MDTLSHSEITRLQSFYSGVFKPVDPTYKVQSGVLAEKILEIAPETLQLYPF